MSMQEWSITEAAQATGVTSRTLRHYEQIGLISPSRVASNGYRFYGEAELLRLYRILSLRALKLPLETIRLALDGAAESLEETIEAHLMFLEEERHRLNQQITVVRQTLHALQKGAIMSIDEVFAGFDQGQYESEVRQRWGDEAWERSAQRRNRMSEPERKSDDQRSLNVNAALRAAAESGTDPESAAFQVLITDHYQWITEQWGGRKPDRDAYAGLAHLYVTDPRFAATYGGQSNADIIHTAIQSWIATNLL